MEGGKKKGASEEGINARVIGCRPKVLPTIAENASDGRQPQDSVATKKVGNLARNPSETRLEGGKRKKASEEGIIPRVIGCRPKVLPKIAENASVGRQPQDLGATKKVGNLDSIPSETRMEGGKKKGASEEGINARVIGYRPKVLPKIAENASVGRQPQDSGATKKVGNLARKQTSSKMGGGSKVVSTARKRMSSCGTRPYLPRKSLSVGIRPKKATTTRRINAPSGTKPVCLSKSLSVGNLARNPPESEMEVGNLSEASVRRKSAKMGCRPMTNNASVGRKAQDSGATKKFRSSAWDLTKKLKETRAELKKIKEKEKELENETLRLAVEIETEEQMIEDIKLLIPGENILEEKQVQETIATEQLKMQEIKVLQIQKEIGHLEKKRNFMRLKEDELDNIGNEFKEELNLLKEKIRVKENEILKARLFTKERNKQLEEAIENYHYHKSVLESLSSEVKMLQDCATEMEMGNISACKKLGKHLLSREI